MDKLQQKATELLATEKGRLLVAGVSAATLLATATYIIRSQRPSRRKLKLFYFDIPGKGEAIRLACAFAGVPLEDVRIPMDDRKLFEQMKAEGKLTFNQLPALQIEDGTLLTQSAAIMRYIGKISGQYPSDPVAAALVDAVLDAEVDLFAGLTVSRYRDRYGFACLGPSTVQTIRAALNDEVLPRHLEFLESLMMKSKTGWIAGTKEPSVADFVLVPRLQWLASGVNEGISKNILHPYPLLRSLITTLMAQHQIVAYYEGHKTQPPKATRGEDALNLHLSPMRT